MIIADKASFGGLFETGLAKAGIDLLRPTRKGEKTTRLAAIWPTTTRPEPRSSAHSPPTTTDDPLELII